MDIRINIKTKQTKKYYLVPHDKMRYSYDDEDNGGWIYNPAINGKARASARISQKAQPEVYRLRPEDGFQLPNSFRDLLCAINPEFDRDKALSILNPALAFCNGETGRFDQVRVMGGWVVTGREEGGKLWINTVRTDKPTPTAQQVLEDISLWNWCVSVRPDGYINYWNRLAKDGTKKRIKMMILSSSEVYIPLDELYPLPEGFIPETHWIPKV